MASRCYIFQSEVNKFFWLGIRGSVKSISFHRNLTDKAPSEWRGEKLLLEVTAKNTVSDKQGIDKERSEYSSPGS